jgi:hypothetical protein
MSPSPEVTATVTDEAILAHEAARPARQLDESAPTANEEAAKEAPPVASAAKPEMEPGGRAAPPPPEEAEKPTWRGSPPPTARSRTKSPSSAGGTAVPNGMRGRQVVGGGGCRGGAATATATTAAHPPQDGDDDDDDGGGDDNGGGGGTPEAASVDAASPIPFSVDEYPQLALDDSADHSGLASAFRRPLFGGGGGRAPPSCSRPLAIAYSHLAEATRLRRRAVRRRNATLAEYESLRDRFLRKERELSLANDELAVRERRAGAWTRKVFDLELEEPCEWRDGYERLRRYREERGRLPPSVKKARDEEERFVSAWLHRM